MSSTREVTIQESQPVTQGTQNQPPNQKKKKNRNRKPRQGQGVGEDRYFGRFHCKLCHKMWESAHVYTIAGTEIVKYKQRCKKCTGPDAWCFPYDKELIRCSVCQNPSIECECLCEDCHLVWYRPRGKDLDLDEDQYCRCDRRNFKKKGLGDKIDEKKPHERQLCQRCSTMGRPCWGQSRWLED